MDAKPRLSGRRPAAREQEIQYGDRCCLLPGTCPHMQPWWECVHVMPGVVLLWAWACLLVMRGGSTLHGNHSAALQSKCCCAHERDVHTCVRVCVKSGCVVSHVPRVLLSLLDPPTYHACNHEIRPAVRTSQTSSAKCGCGAATHSRRNAATSRLAASLYVHSEAPCFSLVIALCPTPKK